MTQNEPLARDAGRSGTGIKAEACPQTAARAVRVYLSGPMTGYPLFNFPSFDAAAENLRARGYDVVNPADMDRAAGFDPAKLPSTTNWHKPGDLPGFDLRETIRRELDAIQSCDAIYTLDGWEFSRGACAEKAVADWLGLKWLNFPKVGEI